MISRSQESGAGQQGQQGSADLTPPQLAAADGFTCCTTPAKSGASRVRVARFSVTRQNDSTAKRFKRLSVSCSITSSRMAPGTPGADHILPDKLLRYGFSTRSRSMDLK